jgi:hypothetical protein
MTWNQKTAITLIVFALGVPLTKAAVPPANDSDRTVDGFAPGEPTQTIEVPVVERGLDEPNEDSSSRSRARTPRSTTSWEPARSWGTTSPRTAAGRRRE